MPCRCCATFWKPRKCGGSANHRELRIAAAQALVKIDPRYGSQIMAESGLEPGELAIAPLDAAPACPWVRQRRYERIVLRRTLSATISSSWGKSSILIRELSLGGGMGTKEDNLRVGSEANIDINAGVRRVRGQVLLRRARVNEVGFEIVNTDLESRYRLRRILMDSLDNSSGTSDGEWDGATQKLSLSIRINEKASAEAEAFHVPQAQLSTSLWQR